MINLSNVDYYSYNSEEITSSLSGKTNESLHLLISGGDVYLYGNEAREVYEILNKSKSII